MKVDLTDFKSKGFYKIERLYSQSELVEVRRLLEKHHQAWIQDNQKFYQQRAINSAYLTGPDYLNGSERESLFKFIASRKVMDVVEQFIDEKPAFLNTQLFFNPVNDSQKNYWHRDIQYHLSVEEQKQTIKNGPKGLHFRIPLYDEPGLEFIPGSHVQWDNEEEQIVRLELDGHRNYEDLSNGKKVQLNAGDMLVFDGNMIHRGLYGGNRLSFDLLFCDSHKDVLKFVDPSCLPDESILSKLEAPTAFRNTIEFLRSKME